MHPESAALLAAGAVLLAPLGARATHYFDCQMLRKMMGGWLYLVAPIIPLKALYFANAAAEAQQTGVSFDCW